MKQVLPHDLTVEEAVLGRMLVSPHAISDIAQTVGPGDFYKPLNGQVFAALVDGWRQGEPLDAVALTVAVRDVDSKWVSSLLTNAPAGHERLVRELVGLRIRRDVILAASEATEAARDLSLDPLDALDNAQTAIGAVDAPSEHVKDLWALSEFIDQPTDIDPWVIPGMFRAGWRAVIVATEGRGKSWLSRQIAIASSAGVHPLFMSPMRPIRTLIVDLENPVDSIAEAGRKMRAQAQRDGEWDPTRSFVWHRPQGIDLRRRSDRAQMEGVLRQCRPDFVALGPLYKAYTTRSRETDEMVAAEVQSILDDLRVRHRFALLIEHHAPKATHGVRDILPYGSSLWLRWPELGLKLTPCEDRNGGVDKARLSVGRWREDRMRNAWPDRIARGHGWPWIGEWDQSFDEAMKAAAA